MKDFIRAHFKAGSLLVTQPKKVWKAIGEYHQAQPLRSNFARGNAALWISFQVGAMISGYQLSPVVIALSIASAPVILLAPAVTALIHSGDLSRKQP